MKLWMKLLLGSLLSASTMALADEMVDNSPLLIDFARAQMLRRVETQTTFYFEVCEIPTDIARQVVNETFENLRTLKDRLSCKPINDVRLSNTHPSDQLRLESELQKELQSTIMLAFHKASDRMAVITGVGEVLAVSSLVLAIRPLAKVPSVRALAFVGAAIFQLGTLYAASLTHRLWIRLPPKILDASAKNSLSVNPKFYVVPPSAGQIDGSLLFDAFTSALDTATRNVLSSK